jgi:ketosteroid isomerase-like protein
MASKTPIHTSSRNGVGWVNVREGSSRALDTFPTKAEAQAAGRKRAQADKVEHVVHTRDGRISQRNSYGNDPRASKG